jgi:hypothetical protein
LSGSRPACGPRRKNAAESTDTTKNLLSRFDVVVVTGAGLFALEQPAKQIARRAAAGSKRE